MDGDAPRATPDRSVVLLIAAAVGLLGLGTASRLLYEPGPILCTYAGSPYLDPGIPDECERGQLPQPGVGECGRPGNTFCIDPETGKYPPTPTPIP